MHKCHKGICRPEIGFHYHSSSKDNVNEQLIKEIRNKKEKLEALEQAAGLPPTPENFEIKDLLEYGQYKILLVHYPNCTNFNGMKCLVVECSTLELVNLKRLDPHFTKTVPKNGIKILARFPPDDKGIEMAKRLIQYISKK